MSRLGELRVRENIISHQQLQRSQADQRIVAIADPSNLYTIDELKFLTGYHIDS
jgi:hypothetical protein